MLKYHNRKKKRALCSLFFIITFEFKRSNGNGIFHVVEISTDKADGMCLWPFKTEYQEDGGFKELRGKDQYVVFADYSPDSLEFIKDPKYHSYADILNELKGKLEDICQMIFPGMSVLGDIVTRCMRKNRDTGINVKRRYIKCRSLLRILMEK